MVTAELTCPPRHATRRTPGRETLGEGIGRAAARLGKPFMPHQRLIADVLGEIDPDTGELAYTEGIVFIPRQQGKTTLIEAKFCHRGTAAGFFGKRQRMTYTAQTRLKARAKLEEEFIPDLEAAAAWRGRFGSGLANGNEHIRFTNGSHLGLEAVTEKAGHGSVLDEAYLDEAFAHQDFRLEQAFGPAMITRRNKLLLILSTAGWLGGSPYLEAKVKAGRAAARRQDGRGVAYFEWSADPKADPGSEDTWRSCLPAMCPDPPCRCGGGAWRHTIRLADIRDEYDKARSQDTVNEFRRSYLNQWVAKDQPDSWTVIGQAAWEGLVDAGSEPKAGSGLVLAVAFSHDASRAAVGLTGWRPDGLLHLELADYRPGTSWAVPRVCEMWDRHPVEAVVVDEAAHEKTVIKHLKDRRVTVLEPGTRGVTEGFADLLEDALDDRQVRHRGQKDLDDAVKVAVSRDVGDAGQSWGRRKSGGDISPVVAVTNAAWGLRKLKAESRGAEPGAWLI